MNTKPNRSGNYPCPCCGYYTFGEPLTSTGSYDLCPVCFWEDDGIQFLGLDYEGGANATSLQTARINFQKFSAMEERFITNVRPPLEDEFPD